VDKVIKLGIMSIYCDSKTDLGGYASGQENLEQFEISDLRHTDEFIGIFKQNMATNRSGRIGTTVYNKKIPPS
jgi:hypothetical protein